jgi:hypothetical protein
MDKRFYLTEDEKRRILGLHQNSIKKNRINEVEVRDIQQQILDLGGYVGEKEADNRLGPDTLNAIYNYLSKMNPIGSKLTAFQPYEGDGTEETFDLPKDASTATTTSSTATTTPSTATTTSSTATTTPNTATTTNTSSVTASSPRTGKEIRQDYRQGQRDLRQQGRQQRRDVRQAQRELADLQKRYRNLEGKMTAQDKTSYETRIKQLQDEIGQA